MLCRFYKSIIITASILMVISSLSGCTNNVSSKTQKNEKKITDSESIRQDADTPNSASNSSSHNNNYKEDNIHPWDIFWSPFRVETLRIDSGEEVFINANEGWKRYYLETEHKIVLSKTIDGGKSWSEIASSDTVKEPLELSILNPPVSINGMTFLNSKVGWITIDMPKNGYLGLYKTSDGGKTWDFQNLNISAEYRECLFGTNAPIFFSQKDGVFLISAYSNQVRRLVFVTHDGGNTWIETAEGINNGNLKWEFKITPDRSIWEVTYNNVIWQSANRLKWDRVE